jgi:hypothetical protein
MREVGIVEWSFQNRRNKKAIFVPKNNPLALILKELKLLRIEVRSLQDRIRKVESQQVSPRGASKSQHNVNPP